MFLVIFKFLNKLRGRGGGYGNRRQSPRQFSFSPAARCTEGDGVPANEAQIGWDGGDWSEVRSRRRKAIGPGQYKQDRLEGNNRLGGRREEGYGYKGFRNRDRSIGLEDWYGEQKYDDYCRVRSDARLRHWHRERSASHDSYCNSERDCDWYEGTRPRQQHMQQLDAETLFSCNQNGTKHISGNPLKLNAFTAFYISNFPSELSYVELHKGLEVCGILSDVHISRYLNVRGQSYGFARFANVRNVHKLSRALNNVYFGDFRMHANVAKFDMFDKSLKKEGVWKMEGRLRLEREKALGEVLREGRGRRV